MLLSAIKEVLENIDKFHYVPRLGFKGNFKQGTTLGGLCTVVIGIILSWFLVEQLRMMAMYEGYYHRSISTIANLTDIGEVRLEDMDSLPFFGVHLKGK